MAHIPSGTFVQDGVRSAPSFTRNISSGDNNISPGYTNGIVTSGSYDKYGPGILYSPQNTWDISPYPLVSGNICAVINTSKPTYLSFSGDGKAAKLLKDTNGNPYIQLDWPRVPGVFLTGSTNLPNVVNVTIFGTDWYGYPLQHTYAVQAHGVYPAMSASTNTVYDLGSPCKAFYTITGVFVNDVNGVITGAIQILVETSDIFGLPYKINNDSDLINFSWAGTDMIDQTGTAKLVTSSGVSTVTINTQAASGLNNIFLSRQTVASTPINTGYLYVSNAVDYDAFTINSTNVLDDSTVNWLIKNGGQNLIAPGDSTLIATASTGDVRGLVQIPRLTTILNGTLPLIVTSYVRGANQFVNQLAAMGKTSGATPAPILSLTAADLYGVPQYYTGVPA